MTRAIYLGSIFILIIIRECHAFSISKKLFIKQDSKLPKLICDIVRDTASKDRQISTVSITIFKSNMKSSIIDETIKCKSKRLSVNVNDFRIGQQKFDKDSTKASIVIMMADQIEKVCVIFKILFNC